MGAAGVPGQTRTNQADTATMAVRKMAPVAILRDLR